MSIWHQIKPKPPTPPDPTTPAGPRDPMRYLVVGLPQESGGGVAPEPLAGRPWVAGRFWMNERGTYRPRYLSGFKLPSLAVTDPAHMRDYLDLAVSLGFNGIRVLAGALEWGPQTPEQARAGLPLLLSEAAARNLTLEVTAITDSGTGYDPGAHAEEVAGICDSFDNVICEVANEPYHGSQAEAVHDWTNLATWGAYSFGARSFTWAEGAPPTDEPQPPGSGAEAADIYDFRGPWISIHLDRSRDEWNMVRRCRELENVSNGYDRPVMNNEPIGWGEVDDPGRRCANPSIAFCMGALSRGFELGLVSHADHGLQCTMPGPVQTDCHKAAVAGFHVYGVETRLQFQNAGWTTSPIKEASFENLVRAYSFMDGPNHGWSVLLGMTGDPAVVWQNGFTPRACVAAMEGIEVWECAR